MSTAEDLPDLDSLRGRVRAARHARSFPLLVVGGLLVNYSTVRFLPDPVGFRYAAALAFVLIWALSKLTEQRVGVGAGTPDYVVAGGVVFAATTLVQLRPFTYWLTEPRIHGLWVAIVGATLLVIGLAAKDAILAVAGALVVAGSALLVAFARPYGVGKDTLLGELRLAQEWAYVYVGWVGAVLAIAGLVCYRNERNQA